MFAIAVSGAEPSHKWDEAPIDLSPIRLIGFEVARQLLMCPKSPDVKGDSPREVDQEMVDSCRLCGGGCNCVGPVLTSECHVKCQLVPQSERW